MIFHSIRWRVLAWNFGLLAATTLVLLVAFYRHEKQTWLQEIDLRLRREMTRGMGALNEVVPGVAGPRSPTPALRPNGKAAPRTESADQRATKAKAALAEVAGAGVWLQVVDLEARSLHRSDNAPTSSELITQALSDLGTKADDGPARPQDLMVTLPGHRVLLHRPPGRNLVMFGIPTLQLDVALADLARSLTFAGFAIVFVGGGIGWVLAGRSLRPIDRIAADAEGIAAGDFGRQIDIEDTESELGRLAKVLNGTFDKMNLARERMAQFTADASHELRTPLTVILADSQGALRQDRTPEEYRAALETIKQSALRMKSISDALLELAHGDAGRPISRDACDLADLADESVALLGRVAREHGAKLVSQLEGAPVIGDAGRLGRVILNLSINAILHNEVGVTVTVTTGVVDGLSELRVTDDGRGIAPESLGGIFERFRRVDASRSRHTGGAGLGLAIVKQAVEAHGGTIAVTSEVGKGTVFVVRLPKA
ncbi:MAG: HAMP domain-containing histidine kinase [Opitutales bacterium]|nr:HAMP domain-containing histidine kinase [Opitutales bacterium]